MRVKSRSKGLYLKNVAIDCYLGIDWELHGGRKELLPDKCLLLGMRKHAAYRQHIGYLLASLAFRRVSHVTPLYINQ